VAARSTGYRDDVIDTHHRVGHDNGFDRAPQVGAAVHVVTVIVFAHQQFHADPQQQYATHQLQERNVQNLQCKGNQYHAQADGTNHAPENAFLAQVFRQAAASQCNDHRIITTQQDVDSDDLQHRNPEGAFTHHFQHIVILRSNFYEQPAL